MKVSRVVGPALLGACLYGAVTNSYPTDAEKDALGDAAATNAVEQTGVAALLGLRTTLGLTEAEIIAAVRGLGGVVGISDAVGDRALPCGRPQWGIRGAWDDDFYFGFSGDWVFPLGSNHLAGVIVHSQGDLSASSYELPFAALPLAVAMVPGESSFATEFTTSNSYAFTWTQVRPGRLSEEKLDARIELFRNGNYTVSTNDCVTEQFVREPPFPHVGIGQDDDWVRANFTNAADILSVGYANWVDAQVGVDLTNGLYKFTATFPDDPPEATELIVGDLSVCVTNAGEYVFVLEKGEEYEFGTWPFNDDVAYWAQDDLAADASILMAWWGGWEVPGEWTIDGGWSLLYRPYVYGGVCYGGRCSWWPTLQGSPDVIHLGESDFPKLFSAVVYDHPNPDSLTFHWNSSDENIHIDSPHSRQSMVSVDALPSWNHFDLSVSTVINGQYLYSTIGSSSYGTNECPQVRLGLSVPKGIPLKGPRLPSSYSFECDVATNGWLVLECTFSTNHVSLWQSATNGVAFVCSNRIDSATSRSAAFYVYGESRSRSYQDVLWKLTFHSASGETNIVSATSTVFGCYCQPIMEARLPDGNAFYNPCSLMPGADARFRADVVPSIPADNIVWRAAKGSVLFPDGANGQMITVRGSSSGDETIGVTVLDYTDERMKFELEVVE